jgi:5-methylcytosine-specific restriction endonuclease McrA
VSRADPRLGLRRRRVLRELIAGNREPCPYCGGDIDYDGPWDLDEIVPRALGGDPLELHNVRAAHQYCNRAQGAYVKRIAGRTWAPLDHADW